MKSDTPNILFIMTDQQHAGMMSCAGNDQLHTPAMDSLAKNGVRFEKAYCTNPLCAPSRMSMATGTMPGRFGADTNALAMAVSDLPGEVADSSMGRLMKRAGYDTFYGGKVHMCEQLQPPGAGYDEFFADQREALPGACLDFIARKRENPFFAVASFINPHDICFAHRAHNGVNTHGVLELHNAALSLPGDALPPLPGNYAITAGEPAALAASLDPEAVTPAIAMRDEYDDRAWRINRWIYHRLCEQVDALIGEILDGLRAAGEEENTLIIFTSDHGNMDASHQLASKFLFYEESVGVPLMMQWKGAIPPGQVNSESLVSTGMDILPTFCDYAGITIPEHLHGRSLRTLAEGAPGAAWRSFVVAENNWFRMVRSSRYKYCAFNTPDSKKFLADLECDPGELRNVIDDPDYVKVVAEHRDMLSAWGRQTDDRVLPGFMT